MAIIEKFDSFNRKFTSTIEWIGAASFLLMMVITTVDVMGTKLFLLPVPGVQDIMMYAQMIAMSFAIAAALLMGRHIQVEFFLPLFPIGFQRIADIITNLLCFILFVLMIWRLYVYGYNLFLGNEVSPTIQMPLFLFSMGAAFACIPVSLIYLASLIKSIIRLLKYDA